MRRIYAEPVCRIKWIRRHGTLSSYCLRRKLHGPFSYAAGYGKLRHKLCPAAASYVLASYGKLCRTEDSHGQSKEIPE